MEKIKCDNEPSRINGGFGTFSGPDTVPLKDYLRTKNKPRFFFVRNEKFFPVGCIAYTIDHLNGWVYYGFSRYKPSDEFAKVIARGVALDRLFANLQENRPPLQIRGFHDKKAKDLLIDMLDDILHFEPLSRRMKQAIRNTLIILGCKKPEEYPDNSRLQKS